MNGFEFVIDAVQGFGLADEEIAVRLQVVVKVLNDF
jgi:hypothetical protein